MPATALAKRVDDIDTLASGLSSYLNRDQINGVRRAYFYAEQAHEGSTAAAASPMSRTP